MKKTDLSAILSVMIFVIGALTVAGGASEAVAENTITWQTLGNSTGADGRQTYTQRFTVEADAPFERLAFCMMKRGMTPVNPADTLVELLPGYYAVGSPRFAEAAPGRPVTVDLVTDGALRNLSFIPDGMHLVAVGRAMPARNVRQSTTLRPEQYRWREGDRVVDPMRYGPEAYAVNDSLRSQWRPAPYGGIPTFKSVILTGGISALPQAGEVAVVRVDDPRHDYFRAELAGGRMTFATNSEVPGAALDRLLARMARERDDSGLVPAVVIEDWADLPYRGMMLDVARNFTGVDGVKSILRLMAGYGLNTLHLHLGDDEGWRLEIPALPELTAVGARRGYTTGPGDEFLPQIYSGDGNPDSADTPANGYYSVEEYIDLLRYARGLGIDIIPEFDTPGHSRAAIRAMERRYAATGDPSLRLIHDGDTSRYTTAQEFHDNLMNPAVEGTYLFMDTVIGAVADIYARAGVPLRAIHIGGDEVPDHAWEGSDACRRLADSLGTDVADRHRLQARFAERVAGIAARHGVKISGWEDIARGQTPEYTAAVAPQVYSVNCWTVAGPQTATIAAQGYPVVLSNVDYLYFDMTPDSHPGEPGLNWGGTVDEFRPLHATLDRLCAAPDSVQANVVGISAHLFAETVRSLGMVERYLLPRLLGLAERAHNTRPTLGDSEYFGLLTAEMPRWAADGRNFYLRQPGIRIADGFVEMNTPYALSGEAAPAAPRMEIRYTVDGSEPGPDSALYDGPVAVSSLPEGTSSLRARIFYGPAWSVISILPL